MAYAAALCALNAKYIHSSLAPWCLAAGMAAFAPELRAQVVEGTINEPQGAVLARILAVQPDAVTFTCYLWNIRETLALAADLKRVRPKTAVVLGGPEVSYCAQQVLQEHAQVDFILSGEGETSVPALLKSLAAGVCPKPEEGGEALGAEGVAPPAEVGRVPGLCGRRANGTPYASAPCVLTGPAPSPYTPAYLAALNGRIAYLETSRGCPYSCAFCLSGRCGNPRWFPLAQAERDLLALANSGASTVKLIDRTFNANPAHANALLRFLLAHYGGDIPAGVCFHFELAGDSLREDTLELLTAAPAGAFQLEIGMQSFCEKTLTAVCRKTDTALLQKNIRRLVAAGNMHVHIDLIAGLPYEDLATFAESFNTGYALGAHMLQLGFLKLLHGAAMREEPQRYPCVFCTDPPYEVESTPWLSKDDLAVLHEVENALERVYNSGRFRETAAYLLGALGLAPFALYRALGAAGARLGAHHVPLDAYTAFLYEWGSAQPGVSRAFLRDALVRDRLATNPTGRLPACLQVPDARLSQSVKALAARAETAPQPGVRRGVALLYGAQQVCFVDYTQKNPVSGRYLLHVCPIDNPAGECYIK